MGGVKGGVLGGLNTDIKAPKNSDYIIARLFCDMCVTTTWQGIYLASNKFWVLQW